MKLPTDGSEKDPILGFCYAVISRHADKWPPKEEVLAEEFVNWLGVNSSFVRPDALTERCRSKGVKLSFVRLPAQLHGYNCSFYGKREIVICEEETVPFSHMHTLFHEFREMLEHVFVELGYATVKPEGFLEVHAEHFAMAARIDTGMKDLPVFFEMASSVEKKWARYVSYALVVIFGVFHLFSCISLPQMEEMISEAKCQRYVRT